jgi:hypothetical protein
LLLSVVVLPVLGMAQTKDSREKDTREKEAKEAQRPPQGVNWQGQVVRATGAGAPDMKAANAAQARLGAEQAAKLDAFRNLLSQVKGIQVDGTRKMDDVMKSNEVRARVEGVIRGYSVVNKRYFSDNGVEIDIEVPVAMLTDILDPDATQLLAVPVTKPLENKPSETQGEGKPAEAKADLKGVGPVASKIEEGTGLVIDARGLKLMPALMPRLLDETGKPVYSVDSLSAEARKTTGVAAYVQSLEEARKSMKAGDKPLVVKATKANGTDVLLPQDEAKKLASSNPPFLAQGRVVIVLN